MVTQRFSQDLSEYLSKPGVDDRLTETIGHITRNKGHPSLRDDIKQEAILRIGTRYADDPKKSDTEYYVLIIKAASNLVIDWLRAEARPRKHNHQICKYIKARSRLDPIIGRKSDLILKALESLDQTNATLLATLLVASNTPDIQKVRTRIKEALGQSSSDHTKWFDTQFDLLWRELRILADREGVDLPPFIKRPGSHPKPPGSRGTPNGVIR